MNKNIYAESKETQKILDLLNKQYLKTKDNYKRETIKNAIKSYQKVWEIDFCD